MPKHKTKDPTKRERLVLEAIKKFIADNNGIPPTLREIMDITKITSTSVTAYYLDCLEDKGFLMRIPNTSRSIVLLQENPIMFHTEKFFLEAILQSVGNDLDHAPKYFIEFIADTRAYLNGKISRANLFQSVERFYNMAKTMSELAVEGSENQGNMAAARWIIEPVYLLMKRLNTPAKAFYN